MKKCLAALFLVVAAMLNVTAQNVSAQVIFETNFDSNQDWNTTGIYENHECSPIGKAGQTYVCPADHYPAAWDAFRSMPGTTGLSPVISIQKPPDKVDHTTGTGKAAVIWQESVKGVNFPGDGILMKDLGLEYPELYVQIWIKTNPNWQFNLTDDGYSKTLRVYSRQSTAFSWFEFFGSRQPVPSWILDPKWSNTYGWRHADAIRGYPKIYEGETLTDSTYFYGVCSPADIGSVCLDRSSVEKPWVAGSPMTSWKAVGQLFDGSWHKMTVRLKMNTKTGDTWNYDGIYQLWIDDVQHVNGTHMRWQGLGDTAVGWNGFAIGGNANNTFDATKPAEQWYVIDDVVVSTTPIPADYVPGGGGARPPAPPKNPSGGWVQVPK